MKRKSDLRPGEKQTDCERCGAPRRDRLAGHCTDCMDLYVRECALGVRRQQTEWRLTLAERDVKQFFSRVDGFRPPYGEVSR